MSTPPSPYVQVHTAFLAPDGSAYVAGDVASAVGREILVGIADKWTPIGYDAFREERKTRPDRGPDLEAAYA